MRRRALLGGALPLGLLAAVPGPARAAMRFPADFGAHPGRRKKVSW